MARADLPTGTPGGEAEQDAACGLATAVLYALTGRRWSGHATRTIEVRADHAPWWWRDAALGMPWGSYGESMMGLGWGLPMLPVLWGGELYNETGGRHHTLRLPDYPVREVTAVRIGGETRDPDSYWLTGNRFLETRHHGGWPSCGLGGGRLMEVDYAYGAVPPAPGKAAAIRLATELARAAQPGGGGTALPGYITQRVRQGETISYTSAAALFDKGRTGLADVDLWLAAVNPGNLRRRSRAWSPDTDPHYRTTSTGGQP